MATVRDIAGEKLVIQKQLFQRVLSNDPTFNASSGGSPRKSLLCAKGLNKEYKGRRKSGACKKYKRA